MKLVREIDGHKFYSKAHDSKEEAEINQRNNYHAVYLAEESSWFNYGGAGGNNFQEDIHVQP